MSKKPKWNPNGGFIEEPYRTPLVSPKWSVNWMDEIMHSKATLGGTSAFYQEKVWKVAYSNQQQGEKDGKGGRTLGPKGILRPTKTQKLLLSAPWHCHRCKETSEKLPLAKLLTSAHGATEGQIIDQAFLQHFVHGKQGHLPLSASLTSTQGWGAGDGICLQRHLGQCGKCPHSRHPFAAFGESCKTRSSKKNIPCVQSLWQIEHIQCPLPVFCRSTNITNCCVLKAARSKCVKLHSQKQLESAWPTIFGGIHCGGITCTITPYP